MDKRWSNCKSSSNSSQIDDIIVKDTVLVGRNRPSAKVQTITATLTRARVPPAWNNWFQNLLCCAWKEDCVWELNVRTRTAWGKAYFGFVHYIVEYSLRFCWFQTPSCAPWLIVRLNLPGKICKMVGARQVNNRWTTVLSFTTANLIIKVHFHFTEQPITVCRHLARLLLLQLF